jgi:hypothetical protein
MKAGTCAKRERKEEEVCVCVCVCVCVRKRKEVTTHDTGVHGLGFSLGFRV